MTDEITEPEPLSAQDTARLSDFARSCKAAVRAVSLYPDGHPAVQSTMKRVIEVARNATGPSPLALTVLPDQLLLDGRAGDKPDSAVGELAVMLHRHQIGRFVINDGGDVDLWLALLRLLGRSPEAVRDEGGIAHLWGEDGELTTPQQRGSVEIDEINYERILRGQGTRDASLDVIINSCLGDAPDLELDDETRALLLEVVGDPSRLSDVAGELGARAGDPQAGGLGGALFSFMKNAAAALDQSNPGQVDQAFGNMAVVIGDLPAEAMTQLLEKRGTEDATVGSLDVVGAAVGHMDADTIAGFVAGSVVEQGGATERLAEAFSALVPDIDGRRQLLSLAQDKVADSPFGKDENFPDVWKRTEQILTEYKDDKFVGQEYARELSHARTQAVEVEEASDDPPERLRDWLQSVDDTALRDLDRVLLFDLLAIEEDPFRWRDVAATVVSDIEELHRQEQVTDSLRFVQRLAEERGDPDSVPTDEESKRAFALAALERVASGPAIRHALSRLRSDEDADFEAVKELCTILGPSVVTSLAELLASEQDARARRRIRDILLSFGRKGREAVQQLLNASNWEVRQTAAFLLREFGGTEGIPELERLLTDSEPLVQREAIRSVVLIGDERTYRVLLRVLNAAKTRERSRETLIKQMTSQRDERSVPLCTFLLERIDYTSLSDVYLAALETLGNVGGDDAIPPLKGALHRGEWWAPFRTRALRQAAAGALRRTKMSAATDVLHEAAGSGSWGVRRVARRALAQVGG